MTSSVRRSAPWVLALLAALLIGAPAASAAPPAWGACAETVAADVQCATVAVPLDHDEPAGSTLALHVSRLPASDPAQRLGTLFFNPGGPGAAAASYLQARGRALFPRLSARYDIVAFDPRGTGETQGAIDCEVDQETQGVYAQPFYTPLNLDTDALLGRARGLVQSCLANNDPALMAHFSTANTARDMDFLRAAIGEERLNYLGFSYGTVLGATYATLFPRNYDRLVLDGPVDAQQYLDDPSQGLREQTAGFERSLGRFLEACAADQNACSEFGGRDPGLAFDTLIDRADAAPLPAAGYTPDPRPVDGDDIINATTSQLYARQLWGRLAYALARAQAGDGSAIRALSDSSYGREEDGTYNPGLDRYFVLGAIEQRYGDDPAVHLRDGDRAWGMFPHFHFNTGYAEVPYALWPVHDEDAHRGPFEVVAGARTPLVVANTYDAATPFAGAQRLARDLGRARLVQVRADGHTAYQRTGPCADAVIDAYLLDGTLPAAGVVCGAEQPFTRYTPPAPTVRRLEAQPLQRPMAPAERPAPREVLPR
jgi:pimeloyl-ACP methyl ester carboxylesterase